MFSLQGKYNHAKVFATIVDNDVISQITSLLNSSLVKNSKIRIMPDTHAGSGCVIGTTMTINDKVAPQLVGVDIGCGMLAIKLKEKDVDLEKLDTVIQTYVPSGFSINNHAVASSKADKILAPIDFELSQKSLGTLGGGNHFIELDRDKNSNLWLVVHSGSRHLGVEVCRFYQKKAQENASGISSISSKVLCYIEGKDFENYIHDMKLATDHAITNRKTIAQKIISNMGWKTVYEFDTLHNYIDTDEMILRKGSVSAKNGEPLLIPINMRDGSLICTGKGNDDWNKSAPHGAGRIMSRSEAKESVSIEEFKKSMSGIYSSSVLESTIDESPMVYKPIEEIVNSIQDTATIEDIIKPIYNYKAH